LSTHLFNCSRKKLEIADIVLTDALKSAIRIQKNNFFWRDELTSLLENRKSLHQQVVDSQMQFEALDAQLQQLQPLATLGMAWAMTAHELNNLLTPIVSYAQLALQNPHDAELSEKALKKAERLSTQAGQMLEKVMLLANPDSVQTETCKVSALLDDVFGCIGRDFSKDKIKLILDVDEELCVTADANSLRQVMMNLILNARHAMRERGGTLRIAAFENAEFTGIEISDTGCGIDPDKLHHIFTPFYTDGKKNGNGLGLAFCQKVIESHSGCISVDSQLDHGTRFKILLPKADR
jgi:two-component system cell cycle sensor histidine kinase/response regulator CckA